MLRRHEETLDNAIWEAETSEFQDALKLSLDRCRALKEDINKLDMYCHPVLKMNQVTVSELANFANPPLDVHNIMKATYLLLGEDMRTLRVSSGGCFGTCMSSFSVPGHTYVEMIVLKLRTTMHFSKYLELYSNKEWFLLAKMRKKSFAAEHLWCTDWVKKKF